MFQRSEPTRSQANPILAQNVLRYENPQNINSNNMIFTLCYLNMHSWWCLTAWWGSAGAYLTVGKVVGESLAFGSGGVLDRFSLKRGSKGVYVCRVRSLERVSLVYRKKTGYLMKLKVRNSKLWNKAGDFGRVSKRCVARNSVSLLAIFLFLFLNFLNVFCSGESSLFIVKVLMDALNI